MYKGRRIKVGIPVVRKVRESCTGRHRTWCCGKLTCF